MLLNSVIFIFNCSQYLLFMGDEGKFGAPPPPLMEVLSVSYLIMIFSEQVASHKHWRSWS